VVALVTFLAISLPFVSSAEWLRRIAFGGLVLLFALGLVLVAARAYTRYRARGRRGHRSRFRRIARDALEGLADPVDRGRAVVLAGTSLVTWAIWGLAAWFVAQALGIQLSPVEAIFITAVINLGVAIPSSPGFIGTYQWLGVSALALFDVGTEEALAFAILMHAVWYVPTTLVGAALLLRRALGEIGFPRVSHAPPAEESVDSRHTAAEKRA
ncbi:MAG: flippase-like domain-containing protein, partial [Actinomycetota bacterium]|nr:flippase-like domain-containing protein [Actinomycetota bacterium]